MNSKSFLLFCIFFIQFNVVKANEVSFDFNLIFDRANTDLGKKNIVPTYSGSNVPESRINANEIDNIKYESLQKSESAKFLDDSYKTRPRYDVNQLGNVVDNTIKSSKNKEQIINDDYCDPYNDVEYKICYKYYGKNFCSNDNNYNKYCKNSLELQCVNYENGCVTAGLELSSLPHDLDWSYDGNSGILIIGKKTRANYWRGTCLVIDKVIEFDISNLNLVELFILNRVVFDDYISITLNDNLIYVGPHGGSKLELTSNYLSKRTLVDYGIGIGSCELSTVWNQYINRDLTGFLKLGKNTLKMRVIVSGTGQGSMEFILRNRCCKEHVEKWTEICDTGEKTDKCNLISKICTRKDYTIKFEGKYISKKCAEYEQTYACKDSQNSCFLHHDDCQNYNIDNCSLKTREFVDGANETEKFVYKCLIPRSIPKECAQNIKCLDGSCHEEFEIQNNTQDMLDAIAILSTLNESVKTINTDSLTMLNGENLKCTKSTGYIGGFKDCCGDGNWGNKLSGCSASEEKLREKKENNDCVYIGDYCSEYINVGFKKVCMTKKHSYCCFENKFSKILANALRQQKLQHWGDAKNTNCSGILIEQLQQLDFSKIDFSELYADIKSKINQKSVDDKIKQSLDRLQNGIR